MGIYGFCLILKQLKESKSQRGNTMGLTQPTLSGYSLMSQSFNSQTSSGSVHTNYLALEIIGLLRICLNRNCEIKMSIYEGKN